MNISDSLHGSERNALAAEQKNAEDEAKESRAAREKERLLWEEEERQRKVAEREEAEKQRLEAERRSLYAELEGIDYDLLSLVDYPTDHEVFAAKRARTLWFIALGSALFLFLASLLSLTSPWVGGIAGGIAFVLWLTHGAGMMSYFPSLNRYPKLVMQRKRLKHDLIEYIRSIEGRQGYIHRVYPLVEFNPRLGMRRFKRLALMSREHTLLANLHTLQDTQTYYEFMVEALKGYQELLQKDKEDAFVESMDFDPDELEENAKALDEQAAKAEGKPEHQGAPAAGKDQKKEPEKKGEQQEKSQKHSKAAQSETTQSKTTQNKPQEADLIPKNRNKS